MNAIADFLNLILVLLVFVFLGVIIFMALMKKGKIKMRKKETDIDYTYVKRKDVRDYVKFDAIIQTCDYNKKSRAEDGIIVTDNGSRFVAGIVAKGFNFYNASAEAQANTIGGMSKFIEIVKSPIQFRQSTKKVDLNKKIKYYTDRIESLEREISQLEENMFQLIEKRERYAGDAEAQEVYDKQMEMDKRDIASKKWMINECNYLKEYLVIHADDGAMEQYQCYFYEWEFDPILYSASELTRDEIYEMACNELETRGKIYIDSLARCSVTARRMSKKELIAEMRAHNQPLTSRDYPFDDFWDSIEMERMEMMAGGE